MTVFTLGDKLTKKSESSQRRTRCLARQRSFRLMLHSTTMITLWCHPIWVERWEFHWSTKRGSPRTLSWLSKQEVRRSSFQTLQKLASLRSNFNPSTLASRSCPLIGSKQSLRSAKVRRRESFKWLALSSKSPLVLSTSERLVIAAPQVLYIQG